MAQSGRGPLTAFILLFCLAVQVNCNVDRYSLEIVEKGTLVKEEIEIDLENQEEVVRVPKHNDVDAMDLLNDFKAGLSVRRVPSTQDCYVFKLDPSFPTPQKLKLDMEQASKQPIPNKVSAEKFITKVLGLANRLALPQRIVDFCGTFPVYMAEEVPVDAINATFYKIQDKGRKKRHHRVSADLHHCDGDGKQMLRCVNKLGHFNFRVQCTYRRSRCYYILQCKHVGHRISATYECSQIVHHMNVDTVCCTAIC